MSDEVIRRALEAGERAMAEWTQGSALPGMWNKEANAAANAISRSRSARLPPCRGAVYSPCIASSCACMACTCASRSATVGGG